MPAVSANLEVEIFLTWGNCWAGGHGRSAPPAGVKTSTAGGADQPHCESGHVKGNGKGLLRAGIGVRDGAVGSGKTQLTTGRWAAGGGGRRFRGAEQAANAQYPQGHQHREDPTGPPVTSSIRPTSKQVL